MHITILGGGGCLGRKLAARLAADGTLGGRPVGALTLFDLAEPPKPAARFPVRALAGDIVDLPEAAVPPSTDVVFHLAAQAIVRASYPCHRGDTKERCSDYACIAHLDQPRILAAVESLIV